MLLWPFYLLLCFSFLRSLILLSNIIHLFFLHLLYSLLFSLLRKRKRKKNSYFLLVHICYYTSSNLSFPFLHLYLSNTLYFTITPSFSLSYILILLPILFCINLISLLTFNPYFSTKKTVSYLSLSLCLSLTVMTSIAKA